MKLYSKKKRRGIKLRAIKGNKKSLWRGSHQFANHPEGERKGQT